MTSSAFPDNEPETAGFAVSDDERPVDPDDDDSLPSDLAVSPDVPVPDAIDQRRSAPFDDELER